MASELIPLQPSTGHRRLPARIRSRLHGARLDGQLAAGVDPSSTPELAARAAWLCKRRSRVALAAGIERSVDEAERGGSPWSPAPSIHSGAVRFAKPELLGLANVLRRAGRVSPRGVALVNRLVTDGTGPLFTGDADELLRAAREASRALGVRESD
jgi:hypothetical protein